MTKSSSQVIALTAARVSSLICRPMFTSSVMFIPKVRFAKRSPVQKGGEQGGAPRKKGDRLPGMAQWAKNRAQPWTRLKFNQFGLHATLAVKTMEGSL